MTHIKNGQALCRQCNLKKGARYMNNVRKWQEKAFSEFAKSTKKYFLVSACPASGKTYFASYCLKHLPFNKVVVISPSNEVQINWRESMAQHSMQTKTSLINMNEQARNEYAGMSMTYQGIDSNKEALLMYIDFKTLLILDEPHHCESTASWGEAVKYIAEDVGKVLLLTGTPWRTNGSIPFVDYSKDGLIKPDYEYTLKEGMADEIIRIPVFRTTDIDDVLLEDTKKDVTLEFASFQDAERQGLSDKCYRYVSEERKIFEHMFKAANNDLQELRHKRTHFNERKGHGKAVGGLIVADSITLAHTYADWIYIATNGSISPVVVTSDKPNAPKKINEFRGSTNEWIIAVGMIAEGVDIPRIQVCLYLSRKKTMMWFVQVLGRILRKTSDQDVFDLQCYFHMLAHPALVEFAKEIESLRPPTFDENPKCLVCGKKPIYEGCGLQECPYPLDPPPPPPTQSRYEFIDANANNDSLICSGEFYDASFLKQAESLKRKMESSAHGMKVKTEDICLFLKYQNKEISESQVIDSDISHQAKKEVIRKKVSDKVQSIIAAYCKRELNTRHEAHHFKMAHMWLNSKHNISSIEHATIEQLDSMLITATDLAKGEWLHEDKKIRISARL